MVQCLTQLDSPISYFGPLSLKSDDSVQTLRTADLGLARLGSPTPATTMLGCISYIEMKTRSVSEGRNTWVSLSEQAILYAATNDTFLILKPAISLLIYDRAR